MLMNLQHDKVSSGSTAAAVVDARRDVATIAISALLLALLIIPQLDGVFLIA
ncbi:MAG: hypothetical protein HKP21_08975 [Xanthomonadales bacterium]|nr:hypothetical protein [Gammaproteobacteria bacterium]NNK04673.1 hypothetical protein [Xanthomonadales bacterium]